MVTTFIQAEMKSDVSEANNRRRERIIATQEGPGRGAFQGLECEWIPGRQGWERSVPAGGVWLCPAT